MAAPVLLTQQTAPAGATTTSIYTVPAGRRAVVSTLVACNTGAAATTVRVHVAASGAAAAVGNAVAYDISVAANSHTGFTEGWSLAAGTIVYVESASGSVTFTLFGEETDVPTS